MEQSKYNERNFEKQLNMSESVVTLIIDGTRTETVVDKNGKSLLEVGIGYHESQPCAVSQRS
jgi:hypothetical protein